jgi:hypothetical protein
MRARLSDTRATQRINRSSCGMRLVADARRLTTQIECGIPPIRVLEVEAMLEQSGENNAAALQNEFGFRPHEDRTDLEHPFLCRGRPSRTPNASRSTCMNSAFGKGFGAATFTAPSLSSSDDAKRKIFCAYLKFSMSMRSAPMLNFLWWSPRLLALL